MVVPVAAAQQLTRGFRSTMHAAMGIGVLAAALGIWISGTAGAGGTAPGATIVLVAIGLFLTATIGAAGWRILRRRTAGVLGGLGGERAAPAEIEPPDVVLDR
jgi:zinc transport system permease protein